MDLSFTEENYLKAIWSLAKGERSVEVSTNDLSKQLDNTAASVTEMLKRLSEKKLIRYEKYKGVKLSRKGHGIAVSIVRKHRLWEVFLMEKLKFRWDEVHDMAEQLEHIKSEELIERLDAFLGYPRRDPHGDAIPDVNGEFIQATAIPLCDCQAGLCYVFTGVRDHSPSFLQHLSTLGLKIGDELLVQTVNSFDRSMEIKLNMRSSLFFSDKVSNNLLVEFVK